MSTDYLNQSPTAWDKQSRAWLKRHGTTPHVLDGYELQLKYDGVSAVFDMANGTVTSRVGTPLPAAQHLIEGLRRALPAHYDRCTLFGELWMPNTSFPTISGLARRQEVHPELGLRLFDVFNPDFPELSYKVRVRDVLGALPMPPGIAVVHEHIMECKTIEQELDLVHSLRENGGSWFDGLVLRRLAAPFTPGKGKDGACIKLKRVDTLDLEVVGSAAEERDTKLGGYITVTYQGVSTDVGSGLTQSMLNEMFDGANYIGRIAEIAHIGVTKAGKLREPRFKGWRFDKLKPD